jgi:integrase
LNALVFLYKQVLKKELGVIDAVRARRPKRLPVVLTQAEVQKMLSLLSGVNHLIISLLYGSGLRLMECLRLRVKDVDFDAKFIIVRDGKGFKDRVTILPESVVPELKEHLVRVKVLHEYFLKNGHGDVELPYALSLKYPYAALE